MSEALANLEVKGVLVDLYVLSTHKHLFGDPRFRIVRVYDYKTSYGAVMAGQAMKLQHCFTKEIKENAADAFKSIDENVKILKVLRTFRRFATYKTHDSAYVGCGSWCKVLRLIAVDEL